MALSSGLARELHEGATIVAKGPTHPYYTVEPIGSGCPSQSNGMRAPQSDLRRLPFVPTLTHSSHTIGLDRWERPTASFTLQPGPWDHITAQRPIASRPSENLASASLAPKNNVLWSIITTPALCYPSPRHYGKFVGCSNADVLPIDDPEDDSGVVFMGIATTIGGVPAVNPPRAGLFTQPTGESPLSNDNPFRFMGGAEHTPKAVVTQHGSSEVCWHDATPH
ncbi:hypothetical protein B0H10DRAFT_2239509 [Mycena sp. CBHHK59/15]|nr:hypothetical protein B0H10DRAFT_2239509 [Mycena sp. CBHHK59/15]